MVTTAPEWHRWASTERVRGRLTEAANGFRRALAIDRNFLPAQYALALLLLDFGDVAGAAVLAAQMSTAAPASIEVLWIEARLAMANAQWKSACEILKNLLAKPGLSEVQTAEAHLSFGLALGELGDHAGAFKAAATGKALQRGHYREQASSREREADKLRRLGRWLDQSSESFRSPLPARLDARRPQHAFLLGFPRSGTTLLEQLLAAHPHVRTLEEEPLLAAAYEAFLSDEAACARLTDLSGDEATAWADHYWGAVQSRVPDVQGTLFVDKQPAGTLTLPIIGRLFPDAKILFAIRDPRDVVLSCFRQSFQMNAMTYAFTDLQDAADCYDACMAFAERARARLRLPWLDVKHEDLVQDFTSELNRILDFLELPEHKAMSDVAAAAKARPIRTPSATQVRAGLNRRGLGRWRQYSDALEPVLPTLAEWVDRFGYAG